MDAFAPQTTKHFRSRMSQRGIPGDLVELVRQYGHDDKDRLVLGRKDLRSLLEQVRELQRVVMKALDKGGLVVVEADGALITTYNLEGGRNG
jgi:hypothetical protein